MYLWSCILFSRLLCNVAFATCTHRLRPHGATRTSIPLRSISVVAFATCTHRLRPHGATRTSIPLRSIRSARFLTRLADASPSVQCVGRGFRHMHVPAPAAWRNAYLDSASLHLGRGFRHMCKKEERSSGMQAFLSPFLFFSTRCSMLNVKNRRPRSFYVCKNSDFQVRHQGLEPWTP